MALNIPMPGQPGDALLKGISTGGDLYHKIMLSQYYGQLHPSGDVANALYVEQLKNKYGESDPRYLQAKAAHELALRSKNSLIDYRDILNQTAPFRASTTLGKTIAEGRGQGPLDVMGAPGNVQGGMPPGGQGAPQPGMPQEGVEPGAQYDQEGRPIGVDPERAEAYQRVLAKQTGDAEARNTYNRAQNLDKTRKSINVDDLTRYSGLKGTGNYLKELAKSTMGDASPEFIAHAEAVNSASLMADQMRQFYKDSIQPSAMDRLRQLSNPSTWYKNPKVAKAQWEQLNKVLDQETETYKKAGTSPINLNKIGFKNGQFTVEKSKPTSGAPKGMPGQDSGVEDFLQAASAKLMLRNPQYTPENIKHTAQQTGKSIEDVIQILSDREQVQ